MLLDSESRLCTVARFVSNPTCEIAPLHAAAALLFQDHPVPLHYAGLIDLGRAVAPEDSLAIAHFILAAAVQDAAVRGGSETLALGQRRGRHAARALESVLIAVVGLVEAGAFRGVDLDSLSDGIKPG